MPRIVVGDERKLAIPAATWAGDEKPVLCRVQTQYAVSSTYWASPAERWGRFLGSCDVNFVKIIFPRTSLVM